MGDFIAIVVISGFPIWAMIYGCIVIGDDDFASDYSDTFMKDIYL